MALVPVEEIVSRAAACLHREAVGREGNFSCNSLIYHARKPRAFFVFWSSRFLCCFQGTFSGATSSLWMSPG
jgi:hypothetical protein